MKKIALALMVSLLTGCATHDSTDVVDTKPGVVYQSLETLNYSPLNVYDDDIMFTASIGSGSVFIRLDDQESPVLGWKIPAYGAYRFKLISQIERTGFGREASAFMAEVRLLDKEFKVIKTLPAKALEYQKPGLMAQEYLYHNFVVDNRDPLLPPVEYMVVMMSDEGRRHEIMVVDQEKEYAKVRGTMPPMTDDIMATASETGTIILEASALMGSYVPASAPAPAYRAPVQTGKQKSSVVDNRSDTVAISKTYREEVKKLLAAGDVTTALKMREQLDALQRDLQADFAVLYKSGAVAEVKPGVVATDLPGQLSAAYKNQLITYFAVGDLAQALGLLDQVKNLQQHVDALFRLPQSS